MSERLFFALWPGERQRSALSMIQRDLSIHGGRATHPEDFHITLVFLGDQGSDRRTCAEEAADRLRAAPFLLSLDSIGFFPGARVLWCGASHPPPQVSDLLHTLEKSLLECGFRPERRAFKPHVTLARKARPVPMRGLEHPVVWPVAELVLVVASPNERPRYRVARRWSLIP